jgi:hypothetical protein
MLNRYDNFVLSTGHLTPDRFQKEMESFRELKGYLPQIVLVHVNPFDEKGIRAEIGEVARALKTTIRFGDEGMVLRL